MDGDEIEGRIVIIVREKVRPNSLFLLGIPGDDDMVMVVVVVGEREAANHLII